MYTDKLNIKTNKTMKKNVVLKTNLDALRNDICSSIVDFMKKHNSTKIDVTADFDDTPIIVESYDDSNATMTMDTLVLVDDDKDFEVSCSSSYSNDFFQSNNIGIDLLMELYEWLLDNEEYLEFE